MAVNGKLPASTLTKLSVPGSLRSDAAASFERLKKVLPWLMSTSAADAYRTDAQQRTVFLSRYRRAYATIGGKVDKRRWNGVDYYRWTGAAVAVPGTSNHGLGIAIDLTGLGGFQGARFKQLAAIAGQYGWSNVEGRSVDEPWHWTYNPNADLHKGGVAGGTKRKPRLISTLSLGKLRGSWENGLWQMFLAERGYYKGKIDRDFGPQTREATKAFQRASGLDDDGVVGQDTWSQACIGIKQGDKSRAVEIWQNIIGLGGKTADMIFGPTTDTYTRDAQRWLGVTADAKPGINTITAYRKKV